MFAVGDVVLIKSCSTVFSDMKNYVAHITRITKCIGRHSYKVECDNEKYLWRESWLAPFWEFKEGDKVQIESCPPGVLFMKEHIGEVTTVTKKFFCSYLLECDNGQNKWYYGYLKPAEEDFISLEEFNQLLQGK